MFKKPTHKQAMLGAFTLFVPRDPGSRVVFCGKDEAILYHLYRIYDDVVLSDNGDNSLIYGAVANSEFTNSSDATDQPIDLLVLDGGCEYDGLGALLGRAKRVMNFQYVYRHDGMVSVESGVSTAFVRTTTEWLAPQLCGWSWRHQGKIDLDETPSHKAQLIKLACRFPILLNWIFKGKPAFTFANKNAMEESSILDRVRSRIKGELAGEQAELIVDRLIVSNTMVLVLDIRDTVSGKRWIGRVPFSPAGNQRCNENYAALNHLNGDFFGLTVPRICFAETTGKVFFTVEEALTGITASDEVDNKDVTEQAASIALQRARENCSVLCLDKKTFAEIVGPCIDRFVSLFDEPGDLRSTLTGMLLESLGGLNIAVGPVHGDYKLDNLVSEAGKIWGIFDCDLYHENGIMILDLFHLLVTNNYSNKVHNIGDMVVDVLIEKKLSDWETKLIQDIPGDSLVEGIRWYGLVLLYWIDHLGSRRIYNKRYLDESYVDSLDEFMCVFSKKIPLVRSDRVC